MPRKTFVLLLVTFSLLRCSGTSPTQPSQPDGSRGLSVDTTTLHSNSQPASPSPTPFVNLPPTGQFRVHPTPDEKGSLTIPPGGTVKVNAAHFEDADGDELTLRVNWGDGQQDKQLCGPCRLEHVYNETGRFPLAADVSDGHLSDQGVRAFAKVDKGFTVNVVAKPICVVLTFFRPLPPPGCPPG